METDDKVCPSLGSSIYQRLLLCCFQLNRSQFADFHEGRTWSRRYRGLENIQPNFLNQTVN